MSTTVASARTPEERKELARKKVLLHRIMRQAAQDAELDYAARWVLWSLIDLSFPFGGEWRVGVRNLGASEGDEGRPATQKHLAAELGMGESIFRRHIYSLRDAGLIRVIAGSFHTSSTYAITPPDSDFEGVRGTDTLARAGARQGDIGTDTLARAGARQGDTGTDTQARAGARPSKEDSSFQQNSAKGSSSSGPHWGQEGRKDAPAAAAALCAELVEKFRLRVGADVDDLLAIIADRGIQADEIRDTIALFDRRRARKAIPEPGGWFRHALTKGWARKLAVKHTEQAYEAKRSAAYQERVSTFQRDQEVEQREGWRRQLDVELEMLLAKSDDELEELVNRAIPRMPPRESKLLAQLRTRISVRVILDDAKWRRLILSGGAA